jgi:hypothetical protein
MLTPAKQQISGAMSLPRIFWQGGQSLWGCSVLSKNHELKNIICIGQE